MEQLSMDLERECARANGRVRASERSRLSEQASERASGRERLGEQMSERS